MFTESAEASNDDGNGMLIIRPELPKEHRFTGDSILARSKFYKWMLNNQMVKRSDDYNHIGKEVDNGGFWFPRDGGGEMELVRSGKRLVEDYLMEPLTLVMEKQYKSKGNPNETVRKGVDRTDMRRRRREEEDEEVQYILVMRGFDNKSLYPRSLAGVWKKGGHGNTRVRREGDVDVDARLVKRSEEEKDKYVRVMKKMEDRYTRVMRSRQDENLFSRPLKKLVLTKKDEVGFNRDLLTRVG